MKHNKHTERIANLKDEIKALRDNLEWALRQNSNLSQNNNDLQSKNYRLSKITRLNGLVLVLFGIMLNNCNDDHDVTVSTIKDAILRYYESMAKVITQSEKPILDDDEEFE